MTHASSAPCLEGDESLRFNDSEAPSLACSFLCPSHAPFISPPPPPPTLANTQAPPAASRTVMSVVDSSEDIRCPDLILSWGVFRPSTPSRRTRDTGLNRAPARAMPVRRRRGEATALETFARRGRMEAVGIPPRNFVSL
ncbi:unnamed protein product [Cyclocybe aegerita]|uniref:Uncharacterized protein n=1 Tax=Cyclocybe aegerita TaxID=1973307 RepID=A0A8S0Y0W7_CYCAE|nr:unnamed protein product [Cyclocybe aegerita]